VVCVGIDGVEADGVDAQLLEDGDVALACGSDGEEVDFAEAGAGSRPLVVEEPLDIAGRSVRLFDSNSQGQFIQKYSQLGAIG
jgi:fructose-1,6-bisphosphatase/sedoheptulose 1,7-bisphosphatase-like protein